MGGPGEQEGSALNPCHLNDDASAHVESPTWQPGHPESSLRSPRALQGQGDPAGTSSRAGRDVCPSVASVSRESWAEAPVVLGHRAEGRLRPDCWQVVRAGAQEPGAAMGKMWGGQSQIFSSTPIFSTLLSHS